jgi:tetratricopeptide (TPR) repeat protein
MDAEEIKIDTGGGASVRGNVTAGGDFVGRDKIEQLIQHMHQTNVQGDYVAHQEINVYLQDTDASKAIELLITWLAAQQGLDKKSFQDLEKSTPLEHFEKQVEEIQVAQREATAKGVELSPQAAYRMGMLAAYRRDYDSALDHFQQAAQADEGFSDAYKAIAWLQQGRAMRDIDRRDDEAAISKLAAARSAAQHTDPLDPQALALRGYIDKTLAQIYQARGDRDSSNRHNDEAARFFEGAVKLDPQNASAYNGLGNVQHARGELDAAIEAYQIAIRLEPAYTAAWHDLAIACEGKMKADPAGSGKWARKALEAWRETYRLAPDDPIFSAEYIMQIGQRIRWYEKQ